MKYLILILFIFLSFDTFAAKWTKIDEDSDLSLFIDESSIEKREAFTVVWIKKTYKSKQYTMRFKFNYIEMHAYQKYDCKNKKVAYKQAIIYDKNGSQGGNISLDYPKWEYVITDSYNEVIYNFICNLNN